MNEKLKILIIEDDDQISSAIEIWLERNGCEVFSVNNINAGVHAVESNNPDVLLLDLNLPDGSGIEILKYLKQRNKRIAVLVISAREDLESKVLTLDSGADDYLIKPFDLVELSVRIKAINRRVKVINQKNRLLSNLFFDESGVGYYDGRVLALTPRESQLLEVLFKADGRVVSKSQLIDHMTVSDLSVMDISESSLEPVVHRLRQKIESYNLKIETVRGFGYSLQEIDKDD